MVPKLLTPEQKESRMNICADILNNIDTDPGLLDTVTLKGTRFESVEAVKAKATEVLNQLTEADFQLCFQQWKSRMERCRDRQGEYIEGEKVATFLPPKPEPLPEPEPSVPVYKEDGKPCFIVIEIELSKPINEKRDIEDLHDELQDLVQKPPPNLSKLVLTKCLTKNYYREVLSQITKDIYERYHTFSQELHCSDYVERSFHFSAKQLRRVQCGVKAGKKRKKEQSGDAASPRRQSASPIAWNTQH
ncbi:hypothetical protein NQ318_007139 [Aromia moschata]|uniref:Uncharacterized protein n=1 Tax=Aromia moschata TaxID=1265417 RepID=A0AAV8XPB0_9CUCU|nr:hypothetical protein NQ318_007139 [Aromia moschata]